jgi:hypothetical protein
MAALPLLAMAPHSMKEDGSNRYFIVNVFLFKLTFSYVEEFD